MRKLMFLGVFFFSWILIGTAQDQVQPLNVKTGLWETTTAMKTTGQVGIPPDVAAGMTPEQRAKFEAAMKNRANGITRTHKNCLTKEKLTQNPFSDKGKGDQKCTETVIKSTGSNLEVREVCTGEGTKSDTHISIQAIDSERVKGSVQSTVTEGGRTMNINGSSESKWLGPSCPAGVK